MHRVVQLERMRAAAEKFPVDAIGIKTGLVLLVGRPVVVVALMASSQSRARLRSANDD